jgi:hypothetical protein
MHDLEVLAYTAADPNTFKRDQSTLGASRRTCPGIHAVRRAWFGASPVCCGRLTFRLA